MNSNITQETAVSAFNHAMVKQLFVVTQFDKIEDISYFL